MHSSVGGLTRIYPYPSWSCAGFRARSFSTSYARRSATFHAEHVRTLNENMKALVSLSTEKHNPNPHGPLNGLTVAVKDNICTTDLPTTCSSGILRRMSNTILRRLSNSLADFTSPFDATAVKFLKAGGANIIGKANCDEFGM